MICLLPILLPSSACGFAGDVIAVIKMLSMVYRHKGSNGAFLVQIQPSGSATSFGCDGETIAVLNSYGVISRDNARTGGFLGLSQF